VLKLAPQFQITIDVPSEERPGVPKKTMACFIFGVIATVVIQASVFAHHGAGSLYDMKKETTLKGKITEFTWTNPHVEIGIETTGARGKVDHWLLELGSPANVRNKGWTKTSLKPGDMVTVTIHAGLRGEKVGALVKVITVDGKELRA